VITISNQERLTQLIQQFIRIINKYNAGEKKPINYGTGNMLFRSEVHTIEAIGEHQNINVTELALCLGVTKGAISQMIDKLTKKGLVNKTMVAPNVKDVALCLTEEGMSVYQRHQEHHSEMYREISRLLTDCSVDQLSFLANVQGIIEGYLDQRLQPSPNKEKS
jgi:DNA-binding MarR family transcriptional regulator